MIQEDEARSLTKITLPWRGAKPWRLGEFATLLNRRGESLGSAKVVAVSQAGNLQLVQVEVPSHLMWDARGLERPKKSYEVDEAFEFHSLPKVEITLNGERRLVRDRLPISLALFEIGHSRAEDSLACPDGSCGLCQVTVDGVKKRACQTEIHRGMAIKMKAAREDHANHEHLCPCLGVSRADVLERISQGRLKSPEAVVAVTHVGRGKCLGQICLDPFMRILQEQGLDVSQWIDWRFPWSEWVLGQKSV